MDSSVIDKPTRKLTQIDLRNQRISIYKKHVLGGIPSVFLRIDGKQLKPALMTNRDKNFKLFVSKFFYNGKDGSTDVWSDNFGLPTGLKLTSTAYKAFFRYAKTDYGSAVVKEMVSNLEKYKGFSVRQATGTRPTAKADYLVILLPSNFPSITRFPTGGQRIFDLAIIHHEFAHTMLVRSKKSKTLTIKDELWAVRKAENPIRLKRGGGRYEPRYVYYNGNSTVNVITGEILPLQWTVSKYDPRIMVKLNHKDAL